MNISLNNLTKDETNIIKGFAIIIIVFHNFIHWTNDLGENEVVFDPNRIFNLFKIIKEDYSMIFNGLFSYFGFYGVQAFIFISGYGLTKQFLNDPSIKYKNYIIPKVLKLYSLIIFGLICYFLMFLTTINLKDFCIWAVTVLLMLNNYSYDRLFINVGPWWYFCLAFHLYIVFPLFYKLVLKYEERFFFFLLCIFYLLIYFLLPFTEFIQFPMFGNLLGHIPELILGIGFAYFTNWRLNFKVLIPSIIIFILSNFFNFFFPLSFLSCTIILLTLCHYLFNTQKNIRKFLIYVGAVSMFIFVINGPLRHFTMPFLVSKNYPLLTFAGALIHFLITLIVAIIMSFIYKKTFAPLTSFLINKLIKR